MALPLRPGPARAGWFAGCVVLVLAMAVAGCSERSGHDPFRLMEGQGIYKAECAACHGDQLQGQPDWQTRGPDGKLPAPALDATGHIWQRPRAQLAAVLKHGVMSPQAPPDQVSDPHAFAGKLTDPQIDNVLAWIETQWPPDIQAQRAQRLQPP